MHNIYKLHIIPVAALYKQSIRKAKTQQNMLLRKV